MVKFEQITAVVLAAGLAIPSYWFFWSLAGGGGYDRRGMQNVNPSQVEEGRSSELDPGLKAPPGP